MFRRKKLPVEPVTVAIESLTHEGRGITHVNGKTIFVDGALPGEIVSFQYIRQRFRYNEARLLEIIKQLSFNNVDRIIYVSFNLTTFARDADILVREKGFKLQKAGIMDMFPHTSHIESIALFSR